MTDSTGLGREPGRKYYVRVIEIQEELGYDTHTVCQTSGWGDGK